MLRAERPLVGLGGGRVVDTAKAIAGADRRPLRGDPHDAVRGRDDRPSTGCPRASRAPGWCARRWCSPIPTLMASAPMPRLAASAMNALAHAHGGALHAARQPGRDHGGAARRIAAGRGHQRPSRPTARRSRSARCWPATPRARPASRCTTPSARRSCATPGRRTRETNAVMLPHSARLMAGRAPGALADFTSALGGRRPGRRRGRCAGPDAPRSPRRVRTSSYQGGRDRHGAPARSATHRNRRVNRSCWSSSAKPSSCVRA